MEKEIYKDVVGYQGIYQVSNWGRVKSLGNDKTRKEKILKHGLIIHHHKNRDYVKHQIWLYKKGKVKRFFIHRLVYQAFKGEIPNGYQIDHIDNNPQNNRLDNLQLLTRSENSRKIYIDNPNYKNNGGSPKIKIICINNNIVYESIREASRKLNLYTGSICKVLKGKQNHTGGYKFRYID